MVVILGVGMALLWVSDLLFKHAVARNERIGRYLPGLERRTLQYLKAAWWGSRVLIVLVILLCILQVWGIGIAWLMTSPLWAGLLSRLTMLLVTAAMVMFVIDLSTFISQKLVEPTQRGVELSKKRKTLVPLTATVLKYGALFTGGLIVLQQVGVNITPILAGVGILSLAVGFGAQTLVKDIINGLFILVEDSIAVGDVVTIRGTGGLVEAVNLRTIWLRDLQGNVHIIPNSQVEMITNMTKDYSYYLLDVGVAYREDTDKVITALQEIDAEMRADAAFAADILAPIEILGVDHFTDSAVVLRARLQTKPIKQWSVGREFNRRMKKLFEARDIELPFPQRIISWGEPQRGGAVPLQLHIDNLEALVTTIGQRDHETVTHHQGNAKAP
jgi:small-conductance mechanosensitive channel